MAEPPGGLMGFLRSQPKDDLRRLKAETLMEIGAARSQRSELEHHCGLIEAAIALREPPTPSSEPSPPPQPWCLCSGC